MCKSRKLPFNVIYKIENLRVVGKSVRKIIHRNGDLICLGSHILNLSVFHKMKAR